MAKTKNRIQIFLLASGLAILCVAGAGAAPIELENAVVVGENHYGLEVRVYTDSFDRYYTGSSSADLASGESYQLLRVPFKFRYGVDSIQELSVTVPYVSGRYCGPDGVVRSSSGLGDILLEGKAIAKTLYGEEGGLSLGLFLKFPSGKSVYKSGKEELPTGTGSWDPGIALYSQEKHGPFILTGNVAYTFRLKHSVSMVCGETLPGGEAVIKPGNVFSYGVGAEFPLSQLIILAELTGEKVYPGEAYYKNSDASVTADIDSFGTTLSPVQRRDAKPLESFRLYISPGLEIRPGDIITVCFNVRVPLQVENDFTGTSYTAGILLKF